MVIKRVASMVTVNPTTEELEYNTLCNRCVADHILDMGANMLHAISYFDNGGKCDKCGRMTKGYIKQSILDNQVKD